MDSLDAFGRGPIAVAAGIAGAGLLIVLAYVVLVVTRVRHWKCRRTVDLRARAEVDA